MKKQLNMILATTPDGEIGYMNGLPWKVEGDLQRFSELTAGNVMIMGRKTFESLPEKFKLKDRNLIVVSQSLMKAIPVWKNVQYAPDLDTAIAMAERLPGLKTFVAGGATLYEEMFERNIPCWAHVTFVYRAAPEGYDVQIRNMSFKNFVLNGNPNMQMERDEETNVLKPISVYAVYVHEDYYKHARVLNKTISRTE
jgi:dihydrofolate reductase